MSDTVLVDTLDKPKIDLSVPFIAFHFNQGRTQSDIARIANKSRQAVSDYVLRHLEDLEVLKNSDGFLALKHKYLAYKAIENQSKLLDIDPEKKDMIALNAIAGTSTDKYRLLSNQATEITENRKFSARISDILVRIDQGNSPVNNPDKED
ncbi:MAG: hypothetical protein KAJ10_10940 [Thermodesulfovibrionia bacterium]|nr:hypothetical protein [Thermodesulfovibrionia bacterium]